MATLSDVIEFINKTGRDELDSIAGIVNGRYKSLRAEEQAVAAATIPVGARCRLRRLSPKYLNGTDVTVVEKRGEKFVVTVDDPGGAGFRAVQRVGRRFEVPGSALEVVA